MVVPGSATTREVAARLALTAVDDITLQDQTEKQC